MIVEEQNSEDTEQQEQPTFEDLNLKPEIISVLKDLGFVAPTECQVKAIPPAMEGKDILVQSRTGSGKTAAFCLPFLQGLVDPKVAKTQALVLAPTRELAIQVAEECKRLAEGSEYRITSIYGGAAMGPQIKALQEGAHIIAGTPGRVLDHIKRGNFKTDSVKNLVFDECDEMLSMGFLEEIMAIVDRLPTERQTMLFSATIPPDIQKMADRLLKDPEGLYLSEDFIGVREIDHVYYLVSGGDRMGDLLRVLKFENPGFALIFCNTRDDTALVAAFLQKQGFKAEGISSDLSQVERERAMQKMRDGELQFLVATDIAARGIDLSDLTHVINYTFPEAADIYVHRTGRTGRAGKSGVAVSLVSPREIGSFYYLKLIHKIYPEERQIPSGTEMASRREGERFEALQLLYTSMDTSEEMRALVRRVWSSTDGERIMALALATVLAEGKELIKVLAPLPAQSAPSSVEPYRSESRDREPRDQDRRPGRSRDRGGSSRHDQGGSSRHDRGGSSRHDRGGSSRHDRGGSYGSERKTIRTRRRDGNNEEMTFTTPDGDVETWEFVDQNGPGEADSSIVRVFINVGRKLDVQHEDLVDFITQETGALESQVQGIELLDNHGYFNVPAEVVEQVIEGLSGKMFKDRKIRIERAKSRNRR